MSQCFACASPIAPTAAYCPQCGVAVVEATGVRSVLPTDPVERPPSNLDPIGPGEVIGDTHTYEIVRLVSSCPTRHIYAARADDLGRCPRCDTVVIRSGYCGGCGGRGADVTPLECCIYEQVSAPGVYAAERRIRVAQEQAPHLALVPIYDVMEMHDRAYLALPFDDDVALLGHHPWSTVFHWSFQLLDALNWLHALGVSLNGVNTSMLAKTASGIRIARLGLPQVFTQDAQEKYVAKDVRSLAVCLANLGDGVPPPLLRHVLKQAIKGQFNSAHSFESALRAIEPRLRRAAQTHVQSAALSDQGRMREGNEDSLAVFEGVRDHESVRHHWGIYGVSDGMGGHESGEVASRITISTFLHALMTAAFMPTDSTTGATDWIHNVEAAALAANRAVYDARISARTTMGATLVAAVLDGDLVTVAHLGDSRAYCWDGMQLQQLTEDHTLMTHLLATGQITPDEARAHPQRHALIRSVGEKATAQPALRQYRLQPGQSIMLCSDGLNSMIGDADIAEILASGLPVMATCEALIDAANAAGGEDNISVVLIRRLSFSDGD